MFIVEDGDWYRASIIEAFPDSTVKVEYVDFGNETEVPVSQLRPVTEDYTRLPLLAFKCSLYGTYICISNTNKPGDSFIKVY